MHLPGKCGRTAFFAPLLTAAVAWTLFFSTGCERVFEDHSKQALDTADKKYAAGDYQGAVQYYEDAIDGTAGTAEVHYQLALLFEGKLNNPLAAIYHFQRYLDLKPAGPHAKDAQNSITADELKLATSLSHGAFMSQQDAAILRNKNLALTEQLNELRASRVPAQRDSSPQPGGTPEVASLGARTYEVQAGDTLASIARKFYKNSARWKDIQSANYSKLKGTSKLKPGMTLTIPK